MAPEKSNNKQSIIMSKTKMSDLVTLNKNVLNQSMELLISETVSTKEKIQEIKETYLPAKHQGISNMEAYNFIANGLKDVKRMKAAVSKKRKELTAPATAFQKKMIEAENEINSELDEVINHLSSEKQSFDDAKASAENKLFTERCGALSQNGFQLVDGRYICSIFHVDPEQIKSMTDEEFDFYIEKGKKEVDRQQKEKERKEAEELRLKKEREEIASEKKKLAEQRITDEKERAEFLAWKESQKKKEEPTPEVVETKKPTESKSIQPKDDVSDLFVPPSEGEIGVKKIVVSDEMQKGFDLFRSNLLSLLNDKSKSLSRKGLIEFAKDSTIN